MEGKDVFNYSLKRSKKVKTLPMKTSVRLGCKGDATFLSYLLFQRSVFGNGCYISFNDCKGHELIEYFSQILSLL